MDGEKACRDDQKCLGCPEGDPRSCGFPPRAWSQLSLCGQDLQQYGKDSIQVVPEDPYRLAADIFGIGFKTADKIAGNLGIGRNSEIRAEAGILYILQERADDGHVYYPYEPLIEACEKILEVDKEIKALAKLFEERKIVLEDIIEKLRSRVPHDDILDHLKVKDRSQLW